MEKFNVYNDIIKRTHGDIYVGVVGPVRTGKSTFITKFMEKLVVPNISDKLNKQIATDEMPQSADGTTIMTTQIKFVPANGVKVKFKNKLSANVRLVDCVGYFTEGATGHYEGDKPRLVKTPWSEKEIPFEEAAEIGTNKVICDYSTLGILVTSDGSFGDIKRESFKKTEEKVAKQLKKCGKPFIIVLNTTNPESDSALEAVNYLEEKYGVSVIAINCMTLEVDDISAIMEKVLYEFPMNGFNVDIPDWLRALPSDSAIISEIINGVKTASNSMNKMKDYSVLTQVFNDSDKFSGVELSELEMGSGVGEYKILPKENLFFNVLSEESGEPIDNEYELMSFIKGFAQEKRRYEYIKNALNDAEDCGYGVVVPSYEQMQLEEPVLVKKKSGYGVKLKASAPSLHIMKIDVSTEVSPIVGNEKQGQDMVNYIVEKFEESPKGVLETNMFGKSLKEIVGEGLQGKAGAMAKETQMKMRKTVGRIVNEGRGGVICILL